MMRSRLVSFSSCCARLGAAGLVLVMSIAGCHASASTNGARETTAGREVLSLPGSLPSVARLPAPISVALERPDRGNRGGRGLTPAIEGGPRIVHAQACAPGAYWDPSRGQCVCADAYPIWDAAQGRCVAQAAIPTCQPGSSWVAARGQCVCDDATPDWDAASGTCVAPPNCRALLMAAGMSSYASSCTGVDPYCAQALIRAGSPSYIADCRGVERSCAVAAAEAGSPSYIRDCVGVEPACAVAAIRAGTPSRIRDCR